EIGMRRAGERFQASAFDLRPFLQLNGRHFAIYGGERYAFSYTARDYEAGGKGQRVSQACAHRLGEAAHQSRPATDVRASQRYVRRSSDGARKTVQRRLGDALHAIGRGRRGHSRLASTSGGSTASRRRAAAQD